jgi:hypothetical protein
MNTSVLRDRNARKEARHRHHVFWAPFSLVLVHLFVKHVLQDSTASQMTLLLEFSKQLRVQLAITALPVQEMATRSLAPLAAFLRQNFWPLKESVYLAALVCIVRRLACRHQRVCAPLVLSALRLPYHKRPQTVSLAMNALRVTIAPLGHSSRPVVQFHLLEAMYNCNQKKSAPRVLQAPIAHRAALRNQLDHAWVGFIAQDPQSFQIQWMKPMAQFVLLGTTVPRAQQLLSVAQRALTQMRWV